MTLSEHIKQKRKKNGLSQVELAERAGVGLRFVRDLEQGKQTLRMDKVNDVLALICVIVYLFTIQILIVPTDNVLNQVYDRIYECGGAFESCFIFSILQIVYITIYILTRRSAGP